MYRRMIVRDVTRNPGVAAVLVVLMMLSVMLAVSSAGTLVRLVGASSALLARADAPHVAQLHVGDYDQGEVDRWTAGRPEVVHQQTMLLLGIDGADLLFDGEPQTSSIQQNSLVVPNTDRDLLLDLDNRPITAVEPGTIVLPVYYAVEDDLEVGDPVTVTGPGGFTKHLEIAGFARDSIMNPAITSSKRLAVAAADLEEVRAHVGEVEYLVSFWLEDPATQSATFQKAYQDSSMPQAGQLVDASTFRMLTMIGDGLVAAVVVLVSMLLFAVGLLCLRFSIHTATEQDYREIGVLKAIGVAPRHVRRIYLTKYALLAAVATAAGLLAGWALVPPLTRNITSYMGVPSSVWNTVVPVVAALSVLALLLLSVLVLLRRFDRIDAVTALRAGATGPQRRAPRMRLHGSRTPVPLRLGIMDVVGRWPVYVVLFAVFAVSAFIMIVPVNSATTANAPDFVNYMGIGQVDLRVDLRHVDDTSADRFAAITDRLEADPDAATVAPMVTTRHDTVDRDGLPVSLYVENGDHTLLPVTYAEGRAPVDDSEIALSLLALRRSGRDVGDRLPVTVGDEERLLTVVGTYQDITNGGTTAKSRLSTDGEEVMWYVIGVDLRPGADATATAAAYAQDTAPAKVAAIEQWRDQTLGPIARQLGVAAAVAVAVALALALLMTALFNRMLIARDQGQIAIQRAIGAPDEDVRRQYLTRMLVVLLVGAVVGTLAANTLGESLFNLMFEGMFGGFEALGQGTSRIAFAVAPWLAYLALPAALVLVVSLATVTSSRAIASADISRITTE